MAKFIDDIHKLVNFLAGKNVATAQAPEKIDALLYEVSIELFNTYYDHYVKTQKISDYLLPFKKIAKLTMTGDYSELPADYEHMRAVSTVAGQQIDMVEDKFWAGRFNSKVAPLSATNIIARIEKDAAKKIIQVKPNQEFVVIEYFRSLVKPKWGYTKEGTRYIYNEGSTVDVEFSPLLFNDIKKRVLSGMGVNLRDRDLTVYSEQSKQTDQIK